MGKSPTEQWGKETHLVHAHRDVSTHPHMAVSCATNSIASALSSGWDMSSSDLNSPQEEKTSYHDPQICQNPCTGFHLATWKTMTGTRGPIDGQRTEERGNLHCLQMNKRLSSLLLPSQHFSSTSNQRQKFLKRKKGALWSRVLLCIIPEHKGGPSSQEGLLGIGSVSQTVIIKIIYSIIFVSRDFPCLSLPLELSSLNVKTVASSLLLGKQKKEKRFAVVVVIGGDTKEMKNNVYIPISLCVAVNISKARQELGEYTEM